LAEKNNNYDPISGIVKNKSIKKDKEWGEQKMNFPHSESNLKKELVPNEKSNANLK
jgi:hypothetical protein